MSDAMLQRSTATAGTSADRCSSARILIIEDEVVVRRMMERALTGAGYRVSCAADGDRGLKLCGALRPHLVITDIIMPEVDGIEVILHTRRLSPEIKIIATSGRSGTLNYLSLAQELGAHCALPKPFSSAKLISVVGEVLASKAADV